MDILVNVSNQRLNIATNQKSFTAGTQEFIRFVFELSDDWANLHIFAQFKQGDNSYNDYLDENNSVYLPPEINGGECTLSLQGNLGDTIAKTFPILLRIDKDPITSDASSTAITKSLYDQMLELWGMEPTGSLRVATVGEVKTYLGLSAGYSVTYDLKNIMVDGTAPVVVESGEKLSITLAPTNKDYAITTLIVTMSGNDITQTAVVDGSVFIENVSGDIIITATAE